MVRPNFWEREPNYKADQPDFVEFFLAFPHATHLFDLKKELEQKFEIATENDCRREYFFGCFDDADTLRLEQLLKPMRPRTLPERLVAVAPIVWILVGLVAQGATSRPSPPLGQFPPVQATSLDGVHMNLPAGFTGRLNLVLISFKREQQQEVDSWIPAARKLETSHGLFRYYELPTMSRQNLLYRWWFDEALRSNTTDKDLRNRILTAYVNKHSFKKSLDIESEKRVVAVLVDQNGRVYWRVDGPYSDSDIPALMTVLAAHGE